MVANFMQTSLLIRSPLLPNESLPSLLFRLAELNQYDSIVWLEQMVQDRSGLADNLSRPREPQTYAILSMLTGISADELYTATVHPFATILSLPNNPPNTIALSGRQRPLLADETSRGHLWLGDRVQFCPACLAESAYHRRYWMPLSTFACLQHRCLLLDRCHQCRRPFQLADLLVGQCGRCQADLCHMLTPDVTNDIIGLSAQAVIQSWWGVTPPTDLVKQFALPDQLPSILYATLVGLARTVIHARGTMLPHPILENETLVGDERSPTIRYAAFTVAFQALMHWPGGFYRFLDAYRQRTGVITGELTKDFSFLYLSQLEKQWNQPVFSFVQDVFEDFLATHCPLSRPIVLTRRYREKPSFRDRFPYLTNADAGQKLGVSTETVQRLVEIGWLVDFERGEGQPRHWHKRLRIVRRRELTELQDRWHEGLLLEDVVALMGVSAEDVFALWQAGMLSTRQEGDQDTPTPLRFDLASIHHFLERLRRHPVLWVDLGDSLSLDEAIRALSPHGYNLVQVIQLILQGKLKANWFAGGLYHLHVCQPDLQVLLVQRQASQEAI